MIDGDFMDYDSYLLNMYKRLGEVSKGNFSGFINNADKSYDELTDSFNRITDLLTNASWDDDIKSKVNMNIEPIKKMINNCESYVKDIAIPLSEKTEMLSDSLKKYVNQVYELNNEEKKYLNSSVDSYTSLQDFYSGIFEWVKNVDLYRKLIYRFYKPRHDYGNQNMNNSLMNHQMMMIYQDLLSHYHNNINYYNKKKNYSSNPYMIGYKGKYTLLHKYEMKKMMNYGIPDDKENDEKAKLQNYFKSRIETFFTVKDEYGNEEIFSDETIEKKINVNSLAKECYERINDINRLLKDERSISVISHKIEVYNSRIDIMKVESQNYKIKTTNNISSSNNTIEKISSGIVTGTTVSAIASSDNSSNGEDYDSIEKSVIDAQTTVEETTDEENSGEKVSKIHIIGTGCSDSILIESNGHFGLIDTSNPYNDGTLQSFSNVKESVEHVKNYLNSRGAKKLDFVVATHNHSDHIGGVPAIANSGLVNPGMPYYYRPYSRTKEDIIVPDWDNAGYASRAVSAMQSVGASLINVTSTYPVIRIGDFTVQLLNTEPLNSDELEDGIGKGENINSIVELVTYKGKYKTLLAADMLYSDEMKIAKLTGSVEVLKMGHHSIETSTQVNFSKTLHPKHVIVTNNEISSANVPAVYNLQVGCGSAVHLTGGNDAIVLDYNDSGYSITPNSPIPTYRAEITGNWRKVNGYWMYFKDGAAINDWVQDAGKWYYLGKSGVMVVGWQKLPWSGGNDWFYFNTNGEMLTGWQKLAWSKGTSWFYFDPSTGAAAQNKTLTLDGVIYEFDNDCVAHEKGKATNSNSSSSSSSSSDGWKQVDGKWTYSKSGQNVTGWQELEWNGKKSWYYFDGSGNMTTGWQELEWDGKKSWYYFNGDGSMVSNTTITIDGTKYSFDKSGAWIE